MKAVSGMILQETEECLKTLQHSKIQEGQIKLIIQLMKDSLMRMKVMFNKGFLTKNISIKVKEANLTVNIGVNVKVKEVRILQKESKAEINITVE